MYNNIVKAFHASSNEDFQALSQKEFSPETLYAFLVKTKPIAAINIVRSIALNYDKPNALNSAEYQHFLSSMQTANSKIASTLQKGLENATGPQKVKIQGALAKYEMLSLAFSTNDTSLPMIHRDIAFQGMLNLAGNLETQRKEKKLQKLLSKKAAEEKAALAAEHVIAEKESAAVKTLYKALNATNTAEFKGSYVAAGISDARLERIISAMSPAQLNLLASNVMANKINDPQYSALIEKSSQTAGKALSGFDNESAHFKALHRLTQALMTQQLSEPKKIQFIIKKAIIKAEKLKKNLPGTSYDRGFFQSEYKSVSELIPALQELSRKAYGDLTEALYDQEHYNEAVHAWKSIDCANMFISEKTKQDMPWFNQLFELISPQFNVAEDARQAAIERRAAEEAQKTAAIIQAKQELAQEEKRLEDLEKRNVAYVVAAMARPMLVEETEALPKAFNKTYNRAQYGGGSLLFGGSAYAPFAVIAASSQEGIAHMSIHNSFMFGAFEAGFINTALGVACVGASAAVAAILTFVATKHFYDKGENWHAASAFTGGSAVTLLITSALLATPVIGWAIAGVLALVSIACLAIQQYKKGRDVGTQKEAGNEIEHSPRLAATFP